MSEYILKAKKRNEKGKVVRKLRLTGILPGVLYGHKTEPMDIALQQKDFLKVFRLARGNQLVKLCIEGKDEIPVLIQDVQRDPLTSDVTHVDFYKVNMDEKIKATIPLLFVGESPAVKALGGTLLKNITGLQVSCLPHQLLSEIEVNIGSLTTFEDAITVSDLKLGEGITVHANPDEVIATVNEPRSEAELAALDEKVSEDVSAVETVAPPKEEDAEADEAEGGKPETAKETKEEKKNE